MKGISSTDWSPHPTLEASAQEITFSVFPPNTFRPYGAQSSSYADQKLNIKDKSVFIEHAKGYLNLGEISIVIAVACKHRDEAYVLSRYIIEEIKKRSPIWKKEHYANNESAWLKGNPILHEKN